MDPVEVEITGMHCAGCARHLEAALRQAGAREASVDWRRGHAFTRDVATLSCCAA